MLIDGKITCIARASDDSYVPVIRNEQLIIRAANRKFFIADVLEYSYTTIKFKTCAFDSRGELQAAAVAVPKGLGVTVSQSHAGCAGPILMGNEGTPTT